jgi:hypothetical protein
MRQAHILRGAFAGDFVFDEVKNKITSKSAP